MIEMTNTAASDCEDAIEELASVLFLEMEHLDPGSDFGEITWEGLSDHERQFYRLCVKALLCRKALIARALQ